MNLTAKKLLDAMKKKGHPIATGENAINLIGVRAKEISEPFSDLFCVVFEKDGKQDFLSYPAVTDCGKLPGNKQGNSLPIGHHKDCWKMGIYMGRYRALVGDDHAGINLCHGQTDPYTLKKYHWTGQCQVIKECADFNFVIDKVFSSAATLDEKFSYTLLDESDLV